MTSFLQPLVAAGVGGLAGAFGGRQQETPEQRQKQNLIDELMRSLSGEGKFSDLFNLDEESFQKSFVDPAKNLFSSQIAPQIQQSFIQSGQQRGTGLDDSLARAGVDIDMLLNQQFAQQQQQAQQNKLGGLSTALGANSGLPAQVPFGQAFLQGAAGGVSGGGLSGGSSLSNSVAELFRNSKNKGFE